MKYIYRARQDHVAAYDLSTDPGEKKNILTKLPPGTRDDVLQKLASWVQYQTKVMREYVIK